MKHEIADDYNAPAELTIGHAVDLTGLAYIDTGVLEVLNPITDDPTGWQITFTGPGHPSTVRLSDELARRSIKQRQAREEAAVNGRKWKADTETPEGNRQDNAETYARRMLDWTPAVRLYPDEPPLAFSQANASRLLADPNFLWLYRQVAAFLVADAGFIKSSKKA
jgi:hypothetical protein